MHIPAKPPLDWRDLTKLDLRKHPDLVGRMLTEGRGGLVNGRYVHWDKLRFLKPPTGLTREQWWSGLKFARAVMRRPTPLVDAAGVPFEYAMTDPVLELVHQIDRDASGRIEIAEEVTNPAVRDRYIVSSLIEESITSSQLEGAATTSRVAKEMLRSGRSPRTRGERMILNNYEAMSFVRQIVGKPISTEAVLEIHRIVTKDSLEDPSASGRLRRQGEPIVVTDEAGTTIHVPPSARQLPKRLEQMCKFANETTGRAFLHPLLRSIILHFWVGYDHPFVDGNGRTARALFYWAMLSHGYWLTEFISISRILRKAPAAYPRSFLYTETDENDLTYFVLYQLSVLHRAIGELHAYLRRKATEIRAAERLLRAQSNLNHRQLALLSHAMKHPDFSYTIRSHQRSHGTVYQTARTDLLGLTAAGLLEKQRRGATLVFFPASDLHNRIQQTTR